MFIYADYHTHTVFSHGKGTIEDNVKVAIKKGLKEIAISDHGPKHIGFGIKKKRYSEMRKIIDELNEKYSEIKILLGLEANILDIDGNIDIDDEMLKLNDILLAGYHFGSMPTKIFRDSKLHYYNFMYSKSETLYRKAKKYNTLSLVNAMKKNNIDIITHPGAKGPIDLLEVARVASQTNTALEINSSHGFLTVEDIKNTMHIEDLKYVISSDAHTAENVGNFKKALDRVKEASLLASRILNAE